MNKTPIFTVMPNGLLPSKNKIGNSEDWWDDNPRRYDGPPSRSTVYDYLEKAVIRWPYLHEVPDSVGNYTLELAEVPVIRIYCRHDEKYNKKPFVGVPYKDRGDGSPNNPYVCILYAFRHAQCIADTTCCRVQLVVTPDSGGVSFDCMVYGSFTNSIETNSRIMVGSTDGETYFTFIEDDPTSGVDNVGINIFGWTQCQYRYTSSNYRHNSFYGLSYRARISSAYSNRYHGGMVYGGEYVESEFIDCNVYSQVQYESSYRTILYGCTLKFSAETSYSNQISVYDHGSGYEASICRCSIYAEKNGSDRYGINQQHPNGRVSATFIHDTTIIDMYVDALYMANSNISSIGNISVDEYAGPIASVGDLCDSCNIEFGVTLYPSGELVLGGFVTESDCEAYALGVSNAVNNTVATCRLTILRLNNQWEALCGRWLSCGIMLETGAGDKCLNDCHTGTYNFTSEPYNPIPLSCNDV